MAKILMLLVVVVQVCTGQGPCDPNSDGLVNQADVDLAASQVIGASTCTMTVLGSTICNATALQRVINATFPGATCVTGTSIQHSSVYLSWTASTTPSVNYFAFRGDVPGGPYTQLNVASIPEVAYLDNTTANSQTYYYVVTAVDASSNQSVYSNEASAVIPSAPGSMQGSLTVASLTAAKGTTAVVPVTLTNAGQRDAGVVSFTTTLPLWASGKVTVTSGTVAITGGKTTLCKWQKAGPTSIPLKCVVYGDLGSMGNGAMVNINIPLPATLSGTLNVPISLTAGASVAGDTISLVAQSGKVTISSSLVSGEALAPTPARERSTETSVAPAPTPAPLEFSPNPRGAKIPTLDSLSCKAKGEEVECVMLYDNTPVGYVELDVFSSNDEYVKGVTLLTAPNKKENRFTMPAVKKPPSGSKMVFGVRLEAEQVLSDSIVWP